jgi:hypothetical protein
MSDVSIVDSLRAHIETLQTELTAAKERAGAAEARADQAIADLTALARKMADQLAAERETEQAAQLSQRDEQLATARAAADNATAELVVLAQRAGFLRACGACRWRGR